MFIRAPPVSLICKVPNIYAYPEAKCRAAHAHSSIPQPENLRQELFETQGDIPITVVVVFFEHVGHPLQTNTGLNKKIEAHSPVTTRAPFIKRIVQDVHEWLRQAVSKRCHGVGKLGQAYPAAAIFIESFEYSAPCCKKPPEIFELVECERWTLRLIEW